MSVSIDIKHSQIVILVSNTICICAMYFCNLQNAFDFVVTYSLEVVSNKNIDYRFSLFEIDNCCLALCKFFKVFFKLFSVSCHQLP